MYSYGFEISFAQALTPIREVRVEYRIMNKEYRTSKSKEITSTKFTTFFPSMFDIPIIRLLGELFKIYDTSPTVRGKYK